MNNIVIYKLEISMTANLRKMFVLLCFVPTVYCGLGYATENVNLDLDSIILEMEYFRKQLKTYSCNYEYSEYRAESTNPHRPQPVMKYEAQGTFIIDRENEFYRDERGRMASWNISVQQWQYSMASRAEYNKVNLSLDQNWEGVEGGRPLVVIRPAQREGNKLKQAGFVGTEKYFRHGGMHIDEYLNEYKDYITEIRRIDDYKIKISKIMKHASGYWEEMVLDSRFGWNLVESYGYAPDGSICHKKIVDYEVKDGVFLISEAVYELYKFGEDDAPVQKVILKVDIESAKVNETYTEDVFHIHIPPGTYIQDQILNINYTIKDEMENFTIASEPAYEMLSESYEPTKDESLNTETNKEVEDAIHEAPIPNNMVNQASVRVGKEKESARSADILSFLPYLLVSIGLFAGYLRIRKGVRKQTYVVLNGKWTLETRDLEVYNAYPNFRRVHEDEALQQRVSLTGGPAGRRTGVFVRRGGPAAGAVGVVGPGMGGQVP